MYCPSCKAEVADDSSFCSACGADVRIESAREVAERAKQAESLLATANLWRMRGKWAEAERCCVDVMRADPNSLHAHSLLGDIYRDQGRYDDAAQWYQLALDLDSDSLADRAKLDHVKSEIARVEARTRRPEYASTSAAVGTQNLLGLSPNYWLRGLVGISVVFVALVAVLLVAMTRPPSPKPARNGSGTQPGAPNSAVASLNVPLPPPTAGTPPSARAHPRDDDDNATPLSAREAALERAITSRAGLACSTLDASAIQPDGASVVVILDTNAQQASTAEALRDVIHSEAHKAAQTALDADNDLTRVAVRVRTTGRSGRADTTFQGTLDRPESGSSEAADFSSTWWAPELRP